MPNIFVARCTFDHARIAVLPTRQVDRDATTVTVANALLLRAKHLIAVAAVQPVRQAGLLCLTKRGHGILRAGTIAPRGVDIRGVLTAGAFANAVELAT